MDAWMDEYKRDLEESRDNQWGYGDRDFAQMNDAKIALLDELAFAEEWPDG